MARSKGHTAKKPARKSPRPKITNAESIIGEVVNAAQIIDDYHDSTKTKVLSDLQEIDDLLDTAEDDDDFNNVIEDARSNARFLVNVAENELKKAKELEALLALESTHDVLRAQWARGMVECPNCQHVFKAEDNIL